jgi:hypothetical protein
MKPSKPPTFRDLNLRGLKNSKKDGSRGSLKVQFEPHFLFCHFLDNSSNLKAKFDINLNMPCVHCEKKGPKK